MVDEDELIRQREQAAEDVFGDAEIPPIVDIAGDWETNGDYWSVGVYWQNENFDEDSIIGSFNVEFKPDTSEIIDYWID